MQSTIIKLNQQISLTNFGPFKLRELEFDVCRIANNHNGESDSRLDEKRRQVPQEEAPAPPQSAQPSPLRPFQELRDMTHEGQVFSMEQCRNLYFHSIEVNNDLIESFEMYSMQILNQPESAAEIRSRQSEQAAYYENIIKNIDIVLQLDQVARIHEGLHRYPHQGMYCLKLNWRMIILDLFYRQLMVMQTSQTRTCRSYTWNL